jgi:hypothetical protein
MSGKNPIGFDEVIRLINYSSASKIEEKPYTRTGNVLKYKGSNTLRGRTYPFEVIYLQADATNEEIDLALKDTRSTKDSELVYAPSLRLKQKREIYKNEFVRSTSEYLTSFIQDELQEYLKRIMRL